MFRPYAHDSIRHRRGGFYAKRYRKRAGWITGLGHPTTSQNAVFRQVQNSLRRLLFRCPTQCQVTSGAISRRKWVVTKPSKLGPVVLSVFALPFLGMGLFAAYSFLNAANQPLSARIGGAVFASVFAMIGGGLIFGSLYGYSLQKKQAGRESANPDSPWLWRQDWAASRVESKKKSGTIGWWIGAVLANMLLLPVSIGGISKGLPALDPIYIFPAALGLIPLLVLFGAIRATMRVKRFGKVYFEMATLPFSPGRRVTGSIHIHLDTDVRQGVELKLWCTRNVVTGSGKDRSVHKMPLWEEAKNISPTSLARGPLDTTIPVDFTIPADALVTDHDNPDDQIQWSLKLNANIPGVSYSDEFELPVFRNAQSPEAPVPDGQANSSFELPSGSQAAPSWETSTEVPEPARHRVAVTDSPEGLQFYFRAGRNFFRALLCVFLAAVCGALLYAMLHMPQRQPIFALVIVGLLTFCLTLASIHTALTSTCIVVGNGVISWRHSVLGIGRTRRTQIADVASIQAATSIQQASSSGSTLYALRLETNTGKKLTLVDEIESRQEAQWIVSEIEKRAGLRLNTQVRIDGGLYGRPPQPGAASPNDRAFSRKAAVRIER